MQRKHHPSRHHFRPPIPLGPHMVKEMGQLVFLWNISEKSEGMTGYELQKYYRAKPTSVYRLLKNMEQDGFIDSYETIHKGRAQRLYKITKKGRNRLQELREIWSPRMVFLRDVIPPDRRAFPIHQKRFEQEFTSLIDESQSKKEIIDAIQGFVNHLSHRREQLQKELQILQEDIALFENFRDKVADLPEYDPETIKQYFSEVMEKKGVR
ncbi:MAG: PadR family transcriptional regulator [Candidatus Heimdallarchaeota archaeon]